jgi:PAS domain S-box-containing protein
MAFSVAQSISAPIKRLSQGAEAIGSGNLDYKVGTNLKDEIGHLSRSFDKMTQDLKVITASRDELNREIFERKQAEGKIHKNAQRFELLSETAGQLLKSKNPQHSINTLCRKVMEHLDCQAFFNFLADEKTGRLHLNACAGIPAAEVRRIEWLDYGVAVCGCAARDSIRIVAEHILSTPDVRTELVKSYGIKAYACHPILGPENKVIGTLSFGTRSRETFSDEDLALMKAVTDLVATAMTRMQSEEALRQARDYLENIFNYANAPIICWDGNFNITRFNHAFERLTKYKQEEVIGKGLSLLFPENSREASLNQIQRTLTGEHWEVVEIPIRRKDGEIRIALWNSANVYADDCKTLLATIAQGQDITGRKQTEEELKRSNENLEEFAYVASHDLQEPLRMMASYSELLKRRYNDKLDTDANEFMGYIVDGAKRMQRLINDLLAYSRVGRTDTLIGEIDTNSILERVINSMMPVIEESKAGITHDELPTLVGSESNFIQLFQNLMGNAIKFHGHEPPRVHVSAVKEGGEWVFSIRDNGIGIEPQYNDRIFLIFQRLHARNEYPGTGIGLSICKKVVETHGGRIWMESALGKGSTFYFTVPIKGGVKNE